jgi:hypothetical protein
MSSQRFSISARCSFIPHVGYRMSYSFSFIKTERGNIAAIFLTLFIKDNSETKAKGKTKQVLGYSSRMGEILQHRKPWSF